MVRTIQLGPKRATVVTFAGGSFGWVYFTLAAGSTLKYANLALLVTDFVPNCECTFVIYYDDTVLAQQGFLEIARGYVARAQARSKTLTWMGRFDIPDDREYTLEMELHNFTDGDVIMDGTVFVEVDD